MQHSENHCQADHAAVSGANTPSEAMKRALLKADRIMEDILELCRIPSPTGYTDRISAYLMKRLQDMGLTPWERRKGGIFCELNLSAESAEARPDDDALLISAHIDTLGLMLRSIKENGRMRLTEIGGYPWNYVEQENVKIITRDHREFDASVHLINPAAHANHKIEETRRSDENLELVLDEKVSSRKEVAALGIGAGDFVVLDPRATLTPSGYLKSRHLDDKASVAILMSLAEAVAAGEWQPCRKTYLLFSNYEEVGHGAAGLFPVGISDMLAVDMGVVGDDLDTDEHKISICAKDSSGPYHFEFTNELLAIARKMKLNYALDIYPYYGSDCGAALRMGLDVRHALIGTGVSSSHGYERIHREGVANTLLLLETLLRGA